MELIKTSELVNFLKNKDHSASGVFTKLKIAYRPLICPFDDLLNNIPEKARIYDIGCGSGMFLSLVDNYKSPQALSGVEIDKSLIENAKQILSNKSKADIKLSVYDGKEFPISMESSQYVYLIDVLHHVPLDARSEFLQRIYTEMAPGATLVIKDIDGSSLLSYWNKFHDLILAGEIGSEPIPKDLKSEMEDLGFETSEISYRRMLLYPHFTIYCKKK